MHIQLTPFSKNQQESLRTCTVRHKSGCFGRMLWICLAVVENAAKLTLVEVDKQNTKYAMQNTKTRNMHGARIITQNASQALKYIPGRSGTTPTA